MAVYSQRVQTMLTTEQYGVLAQLATQEQKPVSVLVREAIEKVYFAEAERQRRQRALTGPRWKMKLVRVLFHEYNARLSGCERADVCSR